MTKFFRFLFSIFILIFLACNGQSKKSYSDQDITNFLETITKNVVVCIDDITEIKRQPTKEFIIFTHYPLNPSQVAEYKRSGVLKNSSDDIHDLTSFEIKNYDLANEKGQKLKLDIEGFDEFQGTSLGEFDGKLSQRLIIHQALNQNYSELKGYINIIFKMPYNLKKEVKIPVQISINDKAPE